MFSSLACNNNQILTLGLGNGIDFPAYSVAKETISTLVSVVAAGIFTTIAILSGAIVGSKLGWKSGEMKAKNDPSVMGVVTMGGLIMGGLLGAVAGGSIAAYIIRFSA